MTERASLPPNTPQRRELTRQALSMKPPHHVADLQVILTAMERAYRNDYPVRQLGRDVFHGLMGFLSLEATTKEACDFMAMVLLRAPVVMAKARGETVDPSANPVKRRMEVCLESWNGVPIHTIEGVIASGGAAGFFNMLIELAESQPTADAVPVLRLVAERVTALADSLEEKEP